MISHPVMVKTKNVAYPAVQVKEKAYPGIKFLILAPFSLSWQEKFSEVVVLVQARFDLSIS